MSETRKDQVCALLKSIETGDPGPIGVVNQAKYIQHNPQTEEGSEGLEELFKRLSKTSPRVNIVRAFEDGDFVFAHTEYDFANSNIGFEVFRFDGDYIVEHWDNIQKRQGPNKSGRTMVDGSIDAKDHDLTEANRQIVRSFIEEVLIDGDFERLGLFVDNANFKQHDPETSDGLTAFTSILNKQSDQSSEIKYTHLHRVLAEGNFVLSVSEGLKHGNNTSFYDLFRVEQGKLVEHWNTVEKIPPREVWKNDNGKF